MATARKTKGKATKKPARGKSKSRATTPEKALRTPVRRESRLTRIGHFLRRWMWRFLLVPPLVVLLLVVLFRFVNPPITHTMWMEQRRLGEIDRQWVAIEHVSVHVPRSVVAAEDANFCLHWGFDMDAIRDALDEGARRGASTLSQQVVKNVFLWQGRSWLRKALEAGITPVVELVWPKKRILEVYLNVAEMDEGVFGIEAAAHGYFDRAPRDLTATQAARIAAVLPDPKGRNAASPSSWLRQRAGSIADGAATIAADGRAACFED